MQLGSDITHIAVVQTSGWLASEDDTDKAVRARAFTSMEDGIAWVSRTISPIGDGDIIEKRDGNDGAIITMEDSPVWGFVVSTNLRG